MSDKYEVRVLFETSYPGYPTCPYRWEGTLDLFFSADLGCTTKKEDDLIRGCAERVVAVSVAQGVEMRELIPKVGLGSLVVSAVRPAGAIAEGNDMNERRYVQSTYDKQRSEYDLLRESAEKLKENMAYDRSCNSVVHFEPYAGNALYTHVCRDWTVQTGYGYEGSEVTTIEDRAMGGIHVEQHQNVHAAKKYHDATVQRIREGMPPVYE